MTQLHLFLSHWALPLSTDDRIQLLCLEPTGSFSRLCILSCSMCSQAQQIAFNFKKLPQHYSSQLPKKIPITDVHISPLVTLPLTKLSPRDVPSISSGCVASSSLTPAIPRQSCTTLAISSQLSSLPVTLGSPNYMEVPSTFPSLQSSPRYWQSSILREDASPE